MRPIFFILLLATVLRLWGIGYGFPLFLVNDEPALVLGALKMIELKTLVPAWHQEEFRTVLYYPPLSSYFYLIALSPVLAVDYALQKFPPRAAYAERLVLDPGFLWIAARVWNALMGVGTVALAYAITRRITASERAGLFAALFLALSFYHLQLSQVVRHWMPASLLVYAAWWASLAVRETRGWKPYILAGLFAGLGMGVNTSSVIVLLPAVISHIARRGESLRGKLVSPRLWAMMALVGALAALFTLLYPYGFTRGEGASSVGADIAMRWGFLAAKTIPGWLDFLSSYGWLLWRYETTLLAAAIAGAVLLVRRNTLAVVTVFLFGLAYLTMLYFFFNKIPRALVFILPALSILAGYGVDRIMLRLQNAFPPGLFSIFLVPAVLFIVFFAYPLGIDVAYDRLLARADTRLVARRWVEEHVPPGTKILADSQYLRFINTKGGIRELSALNPAGLRAQDRLLAERDDGGYPAPAYHLLNLHFLTRERAEGTRRDAAYFRAMGFRYVIVEYEYADQSDLDPRTREIIRGLGLVKRFQPFSGRGFDRALDISGEIATIHPVQLLRLERFGQIVDVYEL